MATESEEHPKRITLKDKATFTKWHEQMRFIAMEKGMLADTSGHDLFTEDGEEVAHYDGLRANEKKDWMKQVYIVIGLIGQRIADAELLNIFNDKWDELKDDDDRKSYAVYLCLDELRSACISISTTTRHNVINEFKLALRSYNADEGFGPFATRVLLAERKLADYDADLSVNDKVTHFYEAFNPDDVGWKTELRVWKASDIESLQFLMEKGRAYQQEIDLAEGRTAQTQLSANVAKGRGRGRGKGGKGSYGRGGGKGGKGGRSTGPR